ncbi:YHS domain-containing protein [Promicromonospora sp. NPDC050880]|uniref:YHS domain-containing protein n=1 Tax=Promicromonospora sp. NPDC050880 TaxID=3364406 RepID=UPI003790A642
MTNEPQAASSCCSTGGHASNPAVAAGSRESLLAPSSNETTTCPVMVGSPVVKAVAEAAGLYRDHDGKRYWFCCAGCGPAFDADPAKYAAAMA